MPKVVVKSGAVVELVLGTSSENKTRLFSGEGWLQFFVAQGFGVGGEGQSQLLESSCLS